MLATLERSEGHAYYGLDFLHPTSIPFPANNFFIAFTNALILGRHSTTRRVDWRENADKLSWLIILDNSGICNGLSALGNDECFHQNGVNTTR